MKAPTPWTPQSGSGDITHDNSVSLLTLADEQLTTLAGDSLATLESIGIPKPATEWSDV